MTKIILLIVFLLLLMLPVLASGGQTVLVEFLPFQAEKELTLGSVMLLFAAYGMLAMGLFGLLDRMELSLANRKMKAQIAKLESELIQLRDIVTQDQDAS